MTRKEIMEFLPHREPMLLVDHMEMDENNVVHARYTVTGEEFFLKGHFPGYPIVPGVILCEIMGQCCSLLVKEHLAGKIPFYAGLDKVRLQKAGPSRRYHRNQRNYHKTKSHDILCEGRSPCGRGALCPGDFVIRPGSKTQRLKFLNRDQTVMWGIRCYVITAVMHDKFPPLQHSRQGIFVCPVAWMMCNGTFKFFHNLHYPFPFLGPVFHRHLRRVPNAAYKRFKKVPVADFPFFDHTQINPYKAMFPSGGFGVRRYVA